MPDQYGRVTKLLEAMKLPEKWHVVEPVPGDLRDRIWIQNAARGLDAYFWLSPANSDDFNDEQVIGRIAEAIANATDRRIQRR